VSATYLPVLAQLQYGCGNSLWLKAFFYCLLRPALQAGDYR
jgi:hypothetical protein